MRINQRQLLLIFSTILLIIGLMYYVTIRKQYSSKIIEISNALSASRYNALIEIWYEINDSFPECLQEIYDAYEAESEYDEEEILGLEIRYFRDPFSKTGDWFLYIPLYDEKQAFIISYLITSAGIDRRMNSSISKGQKIKFKDWKNKISLYKISEEVDWIDKNKFNIFRYLFGKKDLFIFLRDPIKSLKVECHDSSKTGKIN